MHTSTSVERRIYTCPVCGREVTVEVKVIDKAVAICLHEATRGGPLPVIALREEGILVRD